MRKQSSSYIENAYDRKESTLTGISLKNSGEKGSRFGLALHLINVHRQSLTQKKRSVC